MQLARRHRDTIAAAARVLIPPDGALPGADELGVPDLVMQDVSTWPPHVRARIRAFLVAFDLLPLAHGRAQRFSRLEVNEAEDVLRKASERTIGRQLVGLMRQVCYTVYLQTSEVESAIGYDYRCLRPR